MKTLVMNHSVSEIFNLYLFKIHLQAQASPPILSAVELRSDCRAKIVMLHLQTVHRINIRLLALVIIAMAYVPLVLQELLPSIVTDVPQMQTSSGMVNNVLNAIVIPIASLP